MTIGRSCRDGLGRAGGGERGGDGGRAGAGRARGDPRPAVRRRAGLVPGRARGLAPTARGANERRRAARLEPRRARRRVCAPARSAAARRPRRCSPRWTGRAGPWTPWRGSSPRRRWRRPTRPTRPGRAATCWGRCTACRWRTRTCSTAPGELAECGATLMRGPSPDGHRDRPRPPRCGRCDRCRPAQHGRVRARHHRPQRPYRPPAQPLGPRAGSPAARPAAAPPRWRRGCCRRRWAPTPAARSAIPAACCGLVGLKPTYGRVSRFGCMPLSFSLDHVGPLARSAEDVALMLQAIAGADPDDPTTSRRDRCRTIAAGLARGVRGLRLAVAAERPRRSEIDAEVAAAFERAVAASGRGRHGRGRRALPPFDPLNALRRVVMLAEMRGPPPRAGRWRGAATTTRRPWPGWSRASPSPASTICARCPPAAPMLRALLRRGFRRCRRAGAADHARSRRRGIADTDTGGDARFMAVANRLGALVGPFNYLGLPALSLPIGPRCAAACRSACSWWRGHSPRRCCCGSPHAFERVDRPSARSRRRSRPSLSRWPTRPPPAGCAPAELRGILLALAGHAACSG